jgi:hypothetical protein
LHKKYITSKIKSKKCKKPNLNCQKPILNYRKSQKQLKPQKSALTPSPKSKNTKIPHRKFQTKTSSTHRNANQTLMQEEKEHITLDNTILRA